MTARKIMLLGDIGVGKSSIARRLVFDRFEIDYKPTIGVDVFRYVVPATSTRAELTFIVWDTDGNFGQSIFRHVYMREASAAVIVGDGSRPETLDSMVGLMRGFEEEFPGRYCSLVVNKLDLVAGGEGAVPVPGELRTCATPLRYTSALTGTNVKDCFADAATAIIRRGQ